MSETSEPPKIKDDSKVKLVSEGPSGCVILDHVPGWYGEACGEGNIWPVRVKQDDGTYAMHLKVRTPTKVDICRTGDVIKNSSTGGLFVRHFSGSQD